MKLWTQTLTAGPGRPEKPRSPRCPGRPTIPRCPAIPWGPGRPGAPCVNKWRRSVGRRQPKKTKSIQITYSSSIRAGRTLLSSRSCGSSSTRLTRATSRAGLTAISSCAVLSDWSDGSRGSRGSLKNTNTKSMTRPKAPRIRLNSLIRSVLCGTHRWAGGSNSAGRSGITSSTL